MQTELDFPDLPVGPPSGSGKDRRPRQPLDRTIGRAEELRLLQECADRRQDALVLGAPGVGKSHLLSQVRGPRIVRIRSLSPSRQAVLDIAEALFHARVLQCRPDAPESAGQRAHGALRTPAAARPGGSADPAYQAAGPAGTPDRQAFARFQKQHPRTTVPGWIHLVVEAVPPRQWLLVIDDLSGLSRAQGQLLDQLAERFVVLAAMPELPKAERKRFGRYRRIPLVRLSRPEARELMRQQLSGTRPDDPDLVEAYLWHHSAGNPRAIVEMAGQLRRQRRITDQAARDLEDPGARPQLDLTPIILVPAVLLVAARFVARGLGDSEGYILAGVGAALVMGTQFALFRMRR